MEYANLGRSGLKVSRICVGCMSFGVPDRGNHSWTLPPAAEVSTRRPSGRRRCWHCGRPLMALRALSPEAFPRGRSCTARALSAHGLDEAVHAIEAGLSWAVRDSRAGRVCTGNSPGSTLERGGSGDVLLAQRALEQADASLPAPHTDPLWVDVLAAKIDMTLPSTPHSPSALDPPSRVWAAVAGFRPASGGRPVAIRAGGSRWPRRPADPPGRPGEVCGPRRSGRPGSRSVAGGAGRVVGWRPCVLDFIAPRSPGQWPGRRGSPAGRRGGPSGSARTSSTSSGWNGSAPATGLARRSRARRFLRTSDAATSSRPRPWSNWPGDACGSTSPPWTSVRLDRPKSLSARLVAPPRACSGRPERNWPPLR